jgi:hypothetical protein
MTTFAAPLEDLCTIRTTGIRYTRNDIVDGDYPVVGSGRAPRGLHSESNVDENTIIISRTGCFGHVTRYKERIFLTDEAYYITEIDPCVDPDFLYWFLKRLAHNKLRKRNYTNWRPLSASRLSNLMVIVPDMVVQQRIVRALEQHEATGILEQSGKHVRDLRALTLLASMSNMKIKGMTVERRGGLGLRAACILRLIMTCLLYLTGSLALLWALDCVDMESGRARLTCGWNYARVTIEHGVHDLRVFLDDHTMPAALRL